MTLAAVAAFGVWIGFAHGAGTASAGTSGPIAWGSSHIVDRKAPFDLVNGINNLDCGSDGSCVGVTAVGGDIVSSTDPTSTSSRAWSVLPTSLLSTQATGYQLSALGCTPGGGYCMTQGSQLLSPYHPVILSSSSPTGGKSAWQHIPLPAGFEEDGFAQLQCPASGTCFGVDYEGYFFAYIAGSWGELAPGGTPTQLDANGIAGLSCPTTGLCVAVGEDGDAYISTTPGALTTAWAAATTGLTDVTSVSCPTASYCVALNDEGKTAVTSDPQDGATSTWTTYTPGFEPTFSGGYTPDGLSCVDDPPITFGQSFCVTSAGSKYEPYTSAGGQTEFEGGRLPSSLTGTYGEGVSSIGCVDASLCVIGSGGDVSASKNPVNGGTANWGKAVQVAQGFNSVNFGPQSCPTTKLCVGIDTVGRVYTGKPGKFKVGTLGAGEVPENGFYGTGASCPTAHLCVAAAASPDLRTRIEASTKPAGGAKTWKLSAAIGSFGALQLTCSSASFCYTTFNGKFISSTDPAGGAGKWHVTDVDADNYIPIGAVDCPSRHLCVGADDNGHLLTSTDPTGGKSDWHVTKLGTGFEDVQYISCPSTHLCVAADGTAVATSTNPGDPSSWKRTAKLSSSYISQIVCYGSHLCIGEGFPVERIVVSKDPAGGTSAWKVYKKKAGYTDPPSCVHGVCVFRLADGGALESSDPLGGADTWKSVPVPSDKGITGLYCYRTGLCVASDSNGDVTEGHVHR